MFLSRKCACNFLVRYIESNSMSHTLTMYMNWRNLRGHSLSHTNMQTHKPVLSSTHILPGWEQWLCSHWGRVEGHLQPGSQSKLSCVWRWRTHYWSRTCRCHSWLLWTWSCHIASSFPCTVSCHLGPPDDSPHHNDHRSPPRNICRRQEDHLFSKPVKEY